VEKIDACGKICEPLLKSQRVDGRERDAGCAWSSGMSKRDKLAMPPDAKSDVTMLAVCMEMFIKGMMFIFVFTELSWR
jgi:hypothetical protein